MHPRGRDGVAADDGVVGWDGRRRVCGRSRVWDSSCRGRRWIWVRGFGIRGGAAVGFDGSSAASAAGEAVSVCGDAGVDEEDEVGDSDDRGC